MTKNLIEIEILSEDGDDSHPATLTLRLDGSKPDCPITFYSDGKAVFSLGNDEISEFVAALESLDANG